MCFTSFSGEPYDELHVCGLRTNSQWITKLWPLSLSPIDFVGDLEVLKPPLHIQQRKARWLCAPIWYPAFLTILLHSQTTRSFINLGRSKDLIFLWILLNATEDFVPYVLEIGVLYSDFVDKLQFGVKRSDFPRVSYRPMEVSKAVDG